MNIKPIKIAAKDSWKIHPMKQPKKIKVSISLSKERYHKLKMGFIPKQQEDRWFIYFDKEWLHIHRAWSGFEIFKAKIIRHQNGYLINEFLVEQAPDKYSITDDDFNIFEFKNHINFLTSKQVS